MRELIVAALLAVPSIAAAQAPLGVVDTVVGKGPIAAAGATVAVRYTGWLSAAGKRGVKFDSSEGHGAGVLRFALGAGMVIPGWDQGIAGMRVGGKRTLTIPPEARLRRGRGGRCHPAGRDIDFRRRVGRSRELGAPLGKEGAKQRRRTRLANAAIDVRGMVARGMGVDARPVVDAAALGVRRAVVKAA